MTDPLDDLDETDVLWMIHDEVRKIRSAVWFLALVVVFNLAAAVAVAVVGISE